MTNLSLVIPGVLLWQALSPCAAARQAVYEQQIRKTFTFSAPSGGRKRLVVDNISGSISVAGATGNGVELVAHQTIRGESEARIEVAKQKVHLEISEEPDRILIYVDTPWRCSDGSIHSRGRDYYGYDVEYDFELKVPAETDLSLKTVNHGAVSVKNVEGAFHIENVNGGITMSGIAGSGSFSTVNGDIKVEFTKNPASNSTFQTINGRLDAEFAEDLSADLRLKTFNGEVYTDYTVTSLPAASFTEKRHERKKVFRNSDSFRVRVGHGGPELFFDTLNGDIYIVKYQQ
ncbi:MAG TPA: DUF4097 family beta strand repeat-containing protein [Bacteroidota bacterium]|nr:DUF4097 family beta strand repeat-containing protein [Bacteroidota bacterium]